MLRANRLVAIVVMLGLTSTAQADESGRGLYLSHCANCHGDYGDGDGPAAPDFGAPLPDLRYLAKRNGGAFPAATVSAIIDGRQFVKAHGPRQMPVWGDVFEKSTGNADAARERIEDLTDYIGSIQLVE
jgi:mono/diheme cytochrome c family protein